MSLFPSASVAVFWLLPLAAAEPLPDLESVRAHYVATVSAIHSLECRYQVTLVRQKDINAPLVITECNLWRKGAMRAFQKTQIDQQGHPLSRSWYGHNGSSYAQWWENLRDDKEESDLPSGSVEKNRVDRLYGDMKPDLLTGEMLFDADYPLTSLFTTAPPPALSWESIGSSNCLKLVFPRHRSSRKLSRPNAETIAWLDPSKGWLPRKIQFLIYPMDQNGNAVDPTETIIKTVEFQRFPGGDGRDYNWPVRGTRTTQGLIQELTVQKLALNQRISPDKFQPQFPELTEVREQGLDGKTRTRIIGDAGRREKLLQERIEHQAAEQEQANATALRVSPPDASATQARSFWVTSFPIAVAFLGIAALGTAFYAWFFR